MRASLWPPAANRSWVRRNMPYAYHQRRATYLDVKTVRCPLWPGLFVGAVIIVNLSLMYFAAEV